MTLTEAPQTRPNQEPGQVEREGRTERLWPYALLGVYLGFVFTRTEVISWFRIQEMFRFQAFHMYGIIGSAVAVAALGVFLIRRGQVRSHTGRPMDISRAPFRRPGYQYWMGGTLFGLGWALTGACPGPIYVLLGNGLSVMIVALVCGPMGPSARVFPTAEEIPDTTSSTTPDAARRIRVRALIDHGSTRRNDEDDSHS